MTYSASRSLISADARADSHRPRLDARVAQEVAAAGDGQDLPIRPRLFEAPQMRVAACDDRQESFSLFSDVLDANWSALRLLDDVRRALIADDPFASDGFFLDRERHEHFSSLGRLREDTDAFRVSSRNRPRRDPDVHARIVEER